MTGGPSGWQPNLLIQQKVEQERNRMAQEARNRQEAQSAQSQAPAQNIQTQEEPKNIDSYQVYSNVFESVNASNNEGESKTSKEDFLNGNISQDDQLALNILAIASLDNDNTEISKEELQKVQKLFDNNKNSEVVSLLRTAGFSESEIKDFLNENENSSDEPKSEYDKFIQEQNEVIAQKWLGKSASECSEEELTQANSLDLLNNQTQNSEAFLEAQNENDGLISGTYNTLKELTDLGIDKKEAQEALKKQKESIEKLHQALSGNSDMTFEEAYKEILGVEYDAEKIQEYREKDTQVQFLSTFMKNAQEFKNIAENTQTINEQYELYKTYYGSEGKEKFKEVLSKGMELKGKGMTFDDIEIVEEGANQLQINFKSNNDIVMSFNSLEDTGIDHKLAASAIDENKYTDEAVKKFEEMMGIDSQELQNDLNETKKEAFGSAAEFENIITDYCNSQEGIIDKVSTTVQISGMALIIAGGVATITGIGTGAGAAMMSAGSKAALIGTFGDNALELADTITSKDNTNLDRYANIAKETVLDAALYASGVGIGKVSGALGGEILNKSGNKLLALAAERGTDAALSLISTYAMTGDIDLKGEGLSQFLAVLSGAAASKISAQNTKAQGNADNIKDVEIETSKMNLEDRTILDTDNVTQEINNKVVKKNDFAQNPGESINISEKIAQETQKMQNWSTEQIKSKMQEAGFDGNYMNRNLRDEYFTAQRCAIAQELKTMFPDAYDVDIVDLGYNLKPDGFKKLAILYNIDSDIDIMFKQVEKFGENFEGLNGARYEAMQSLNLNEMNSVKLINRNEITITQIPDIKNSFDKYNLIINGERLDAGLSSRISELGQKFGIEIKIDNDAISKNYKGEQCSSKIITEDYIANLEKALEKLQSSDMRNPSSIYLSDMIMQQANNIKASGVFNASNPDSVIISTECPSNYVQGTLLHETRHLNDFDEAKGYYQSTHRARQMGLEEMGSLAGLHMTFSKDNVLTAADVSKYIRSYALTNEHEIVAEVGMLIANGNIVKDTNNNYVINTANLPPGYCESWKGTSEDTKKLNMIMDFYDLLTN